MTDEQTVLSHFGGTARLFPLPNLILFPQVVQPLHIFEPRYRQMTADALADDGLIALVLLQPGWEADYQARPAIHPVACLGKIVADQRLEDGRFNILVRGLSRAHILRELAVPKLYRTAQVELLEDGPVAKVTKARKLRRQLARIAHDRLSAQEQLAAQFRQLVKSALPLGTLCDILAFALPLDVEFKQTLLARLDVEERVRGLLEHLETHAPEPSADAGERSFPPEFSTN